MGLNDQIPNQTNYEEQQNYEIDIFKVYTDVINEIESIRSVVSISDKKNQQVLNSLTQKSLATLRQHLKIETKPQESRCHAFFRLIGFPVFGKDNIYNPGLNTININKRTINNEYKFKVMSSLTPGFRKISLFRETYLSSLLNIFNATSSIDASTLVLSSLNNRGFSAASEKTKTTYTAETDLSENDQSYDYELEGLVGFNIISLYEYIDALGNSPTKITHKRSHIIIPFMVDPWIDFSVCPNSHLIAVPFVPDQSNLKIGENKFVKRPLLEKVIRDRFSNPEVDPNGAFTQAIQDYIKTVPEIQNTELISIFQDTKLMSEQIQLRKYIYMIKSMISKLIEAKNKAIKAQSLYYWLPMPSSTGPEGGINIRPITSQMSPKIEAAGLVTSDDRDLITAIMKDTANQVNTQMGSVTGTPDVGGFALQAYTYTLMPDTTSAYGDVNKKIVEQCNRRRNQIMSDAGKALQTIEIIMGEFSGLGLCDIIAILGALYTMPSDKLLGFLDIDAFNRAKSVLKLNIDTPPNPREALDAFTKSVKDFYNLMDKIYLDQTNNNSLL